MEFFRRLFRRLKLTEAPAAYVEIPGRVATAPTQVRVNALGVAVFSLPDHLAASDVPYASPSTPLPIDPRFVAGWTPKNDCVFVLPLEAADRSSGGIITPDLSRERPHKGVVLAVGAGLWDDEQAKVYQVEAAVGDLVTYGHYSGETFDLDGLTVLIVRNVEIKARKLAGTYALIDHHLDVDGLNERRIYHEVHAMCEHCPKPVTEALDAERARYQAEQKALLAGEEEGFEDLVNDDVNVCHAFHPSHGANAACDLPVAHEGDHSAAVMLSIAQGVANPATRVQWPSSAQRAETLRETLPAACEMSHPVFPVIECTRPKGHEGYHSGIDHVAAEEVTWT